MNSNLKENKVIRRVVPTEDKKVTKKVLRKVFLRSVPMEFSWNYERMMHAGYCYSMIPALKEIYKDDKEELSKALVRHMEFYNTTPYVITLPLGISVAMEEKRAKDKENFDTTTISTVKTAIMGPLAGIGDSFFWGTLRILATGVGTTLALQGNILGPILFLLIFNVPHFLIRYLFTFVGYDLGTDFFEKVEKTGLMSLITYGAAIIGLIVAGAMTAEMVYMTIPIAIGTGETATTIQAILDGIIPGLMPLLLTGGVYWLLKKGWKPLTLTFLLMLLGILGALLGFLA